jgi:hypothetical protein
MRDSETNEKFSFLIDSRRLKLLTTIDSDVCKVVSEALDMWLEKKVLTCPFTKNFCENNGPCNDCSFSV